MCFSYYLYFIPGGDSSIIRTYGTHKNYIFHFFYLQHLVLFSMVPRNIVFFHSRSVMGACPATTGCIVYVCGL